MKLKEPLSSSPEIYLITATIYYWTLTSNLFNPIAIILLVVLIYQLISKNKSLGLIIAGVFIILNIFMVLALISELSEFSTASQSAVNLLLVGSLFLGLNVTVASFMFLKYIKRNIV